MRVTLLFLGCLTLTQFCFAQFFSENFDTLVPELGQQIPDGWTSENRNSDNAFWDVLPNSVSFPNNARSAPNAIHMSFDPNNTADDWLITPALPLAKGNRYTVRFWYRNIDTGFDTVEKLKVHLGTGAGSTVMDSIPLFIDDAITNMTYKLAEFSFIASDSADHYLGFHAFSEPFQFLLAFDDLEVEEMVVSAIEEPAWTRQIRVFPNPATQWIEFQLPPDNLGFQLQLFNNQGQMVLQKKQLDTNNLIPLSELPSGIYAYLIRDTKGHFSGGRFTIIK